MTLLIKNDGYPIFNKIGFNILYVTMKGVPIITNFKLLIYQIFTQANLI